MASLHEAAALRRTLQDEIGQELRARFDEVLKRELSTHLLYLLARLERAESQKAQKPEVS
jgi:hypothetical protein